MCRVTQEPEQPKPLRDLADELAHRDWRVSLRGDELNVTNPSAGRLGETIVVRGDTYSWPWGQEIGSTSDVPGTADRVQHVLRVRDDR